MILPVLGTSIAGSLLLAQVRKDQNECTGLPCYLQQAFAIALLHLAGLALYHMVLYPFYLSPLRHLPSPSQLPLRRRVLQEPTYEKLVKWINEVPNDGLIRYHGIFNAERVLVTTPQGCKDVLQTQGYNFIKLPWALQVMGQLAPQGILVAPPVKHRVWRHPP